MLIHLEKLGKSFGEKVVLHDVSASVEKEDRIGIVGQNGAGKTTLLKILTGVYTDYDGEFSVTHGVTLGYLEQNAKLDVTLDIYGEMRSSFAPVLDAMAQMQILEKKMAASPDDAALLEKHDELQNIIDAADGYNMDVNIKKVLSGMGFAQDTWSKNVGVLSGGELTRLRLAKLLLEKPDVLILDEPTNHLDFATMEWLENYLKGYSGAVLVVSHDRYFLDNVCTKIWEVSFQTMTTYKGNFSAYLPQKEAADALRQKQHDADVALAEKLQDYIDRNLVRASTTKMAQSRRKQLEKLEITEAPQDETNQLKFRFEYDVEPWNELVLLKNLTIKIGDRTLLASGLRGQRTYSFHASDNIITQYQRLAAALLEETEQTNAFLNTEAAYNRFVYDHYTDIPDDIRGFLEEKLGGYQKDEGQVHFDYRRAKQNILFYLTTYITYEENVLPITGGDFALTFLDGTQSGYDVHYATAAALMFRYYGIPARYVEGFLVTKDDAAHMTAGQTLPVDGSRAHAWVEYYQDGLGWLPFEVTPPYFSAMEKAEQYQSISGLVGQAPLEDTPEQPDDTDARDPVTEALRELWLKHGMTVLLVLLVSLAVVLAAVLLGRILRERRRTRQRKASFFGADAAAAIDAIFRYTMDVLRARGMAARNCPPEDYVAYMDQDLREDYLQAARLWQEARFRGRPMTEGQRRRVLRLKDEIWRRTWHNAGLRQRLRLKYVEFL